MTGFVFVAVVALAVVDVVSPVVRAAIGFPLLLFVPGYATVSALFPRAASASLARRDGLLIGQTRHVSEVERWALAFGLSVALLPVIGLGVALVGFSTSTVVAGVSAYALFGLWIAAIRRFRVLRTDRYRFAARRKLTSVRNAIVDPESTIHTTVNVVLVVSMLIALTTAGYAFASPGSGEEYTDLHYLTENDSGDLVASAPSSVETNESIPLTVSVENQEGESMEYTVVVYEQWVTDGEVRERMELDRLEYSLVDGATGHGEPSLTPDAESGEIQVAVLLYDDEVPDDPTLDNAYRSTYFWIEVTDDPATDE